METIITLEGLPAIVAREENPPAGEKPIVWRLLTNRTVDTLEQASELIDGYRPLADRNFLSRIKKWLSGRIPATE
ncbi:MAG: hypothetical protein NTW85_10820 [Methylococcales bacterium]|nr:hypothetical protein [Methylococcales bacterium]